MLEQSGLARRSKPWDGIKNRAALGLRPTLAVLRNSETVGLIA